MEAETRFKQLHAAYEVLTNSASSPAKNINPEEKYDFFFRPAPKPAPPVHYVNRLDSAFEAAMETGDPACLQEMLNHHPHTESLLKDLLFFSCKAGHFDIARWLIEEKNISSRLVIQTNSFLDGAIFKVAAIGGSLPLVRYLLKKGADIESQGLFPGTKATALSCAAEHGHEAMVAWLIRKGARLNPDISNSNMLNQGIDSGNPKIVRLLIEGGADFDSFHLQRALRNGNQSIVRYLLSLKPGLENHQSWDTLAIAAIVSGNVEMLHYLVAEEKLDIFAKRRSWQTPENVRSLILQAAGESGSSEMLKYLFEQHGLLQDCRDNPAHLKSLMCSAVRDTIGRRAPSRERLKLIRYILEESNLYLPPE